MRQSIGVHDVRTPQIFGLVEKGKGLKGGERKGEKEGRKWTLPDFYID